MSNMLIKHEAGKPAAMEAAAPVASPAKVRAGLRQRVRRRLPLGEGRGPQRVSQRSGVVK